MSYASKHARPRLSLVTGQVAGPSDAPPVLPDDAQLLACVQAGDVSATAALHDRLRPVVDRTIRRLLGPGDPDEQDVAQHALIELVTTLDRYRGDCSLDSWTTTITAHAIYNYIRRRKTERRVFSELRAHLPPETPWTSRASRQAIARSALQRVLACLEHVEETKAWTFLLHDVWGHDLREVAAITGVGVAAAQSRLVRGRREIQDRLARDPELTSLLESMGYGR
jgi:RNA polymerase sigma-70 factor (ECF subfamily)